MSPEEYTPFPFSHKKKNKKPNVTFSETYLMPLNSNYEIFAFHKVCPLLLDLTPTTSPLLKLLEAILTRLTVTHTFLALLTKQKKSKTMT